MKVRECMSKSVVFVSPQDTLQTAAKRMKEADIGYLPIVNNNTIEGVITDRDIVLCGVAQGIDPSKGRVSQCETKSVYSVSPDIDVKEAAKIMERHRVRRLPVVEGERLIGVLSVGDLARSEEAMPLSCEVLHEVVTKRSSRSRA